MSEGVGFPSLNDSASNRPPTLGKSEVPDGAKDKYSEEEQKKENQKQARDARKKEKEIIERAVKRFKKAMEAESENRKNSLEDLKFKAGEQWPSDIQADRAMKKRPCLTINGLPTLTHQISNDIRQNRPAINVSPLGDEATKEAAELYASFIRAIERDSAADIAYDTAVTSAVDIGFGYWRILTEYESADSFDQVIVVRRVRNPFTILLDPKRQEPDGCDSRYAFVSELMDREDFKEQYPDARFVSWKEAGIGEAWKEWTTKDQVRIAEYIEVTHELKRLVRLSSGHEGFYDDLSEYVLGKIASLEVEIIDDREAEVQVVDWYRLTSAEILESKRWPGKWIPIIEVLGEEIDIEGKVIRSGIIRNAKDPMRLKNFAVTAKAESVGQVPKTPWVAPEGSFEGYEDEWDRATTENVSRLEYVQQYGEQGQPLQVPTRQKPADIPAGWVEIEKSSEQDLMRTTGVQFNAPVSEKSYDESGKAIRELRRNSDVGSFHFSDNLSRSLRHTGRIFLDLIPKVYNRRRMVPTVGEDQKESRIMVDPTAPKPIGKINNPDKKQPPIKVLNPTMGKYGVTVTIGPSYATKRIEAQEQLTQVIAKLPEAMRGVAAALMAKNSDWPGSTELYKALAKMLPPGILSPDMGDLSPEVSAMVQSMSQQIAKLMQERTQMLRDLTDKRTDQALIRDKIDKDFNAKLIKIMADIKKTADRNDIDILQGLIGANAAISNSTEKVKIPDPKQGQTQNAPRTMM